MSLFTRNKFIDLHGDEAGVSIDDLGFALTTWVAMAADNKSVADAALAFNTTVEVIREAVNQAAWAFLDGEDNDPAKQRIELEGE